MAHLLAHLFLKIIMLRSFKSLRVKHGTYLDGLLNTDSFWFWLFFKRHKFVIEVYLTFLGLNFFFTIYFLWFRNHFIFWLRITLRLIKLYRGRSEVTWIKIYFKFHGYHCRHISYIWYYIWYNLHHTSLAYKYVMLYDSYKTSIISILGYSQLKNEVVRKFRKSNQIWMIKG